MQSNITGHTCNCEINQSWDTVFLDLLLYNLLSFVPSRFCALHTQESCHAHLQLSAFVVPVASVTFLQFTISYSFLKSQVKYHLCLEAFLGPPKAKFITQSFEMLYLVEVTTVIKFWYIYFVFLQFCTLLINFNKNES